MSDAWKPSGGSVLWIDVDKQEYEVEIPICAKLLMFDIAGDRTHKCKSGRYMICTDFMINNYQSLLDCYKDGQFKSSVEQMLNYYETSVSKTSSSLSSSSKTSTSLQVFDDDDALRVVDPCIVATVIHNAHLYVETDNEEGYDNIVVDNDRDIVYLLPTTITTTNQLSSTF